MQTFAKLIASTCLTLSLAGCYGHKANVGEYVERAKKHIESGEIAAAKTDLKAALRINPGEPNANLALAKLEDQEGDLQSAVPHYLRAAVPDARLLEAQLRIVEILIDSSRLREASGILNATLGVFPGSAEALALRADIQERQNQSDGARVDAEAVLKKDPGNARASSVLALVALHDGDESHALTILTGALAKHPNDIRLLQVQAAALIMADKPGQAIAALRSVTHSAPHDAIVQSALANLQASNGQIDEALEGFKAAVAADPTNQDMQLAFVKFLVERKPGTDVVDYLQKRIAEFPRTGTYDLALAGYDRAQGKLADSQQVLEAGASRLGGGSDAAPLNVALARVEAARGQSGAALAILDRVLAADATNEDALFYRAQLNLAAGRYPAAVDDLMLIVRGNPLNSQAFQMLATAYMAQRDPQSAVGAMRRAVATQSGDDNAQVQMAGFLQAAGDVSGARDIMARLTLSYPGVPAIWLADGEIAIARKDYAEAARALARLRQIPDTQSNAFMLEGQLDAARGDAKGALGSYLNASKLNGDIDPSVFGAIAKSAVSAGQSASVAQQLTDRVGQLKPQAQKNCWLAISLLQLRAGHPQDAEAAFKHVVALAPTDPGNYAIYVGVLIELKMYAEAQAVLSAAITAGASPAPLLLLKGWAYESAGDLGQAQASYHDAIKADPLSIQAANNYANILLDREPKNIDALKESRARLVGAENEADPAIIDTIAWLDYRLGRYDEAKQLLQRIKAGDSDNPQLRFHLAAVLLASGDRQGGLALLDTVKGLSFPGSDEARGLSAT